MFTVELYARIRRAVMADGLSRRDAAKQFGVHRNTISKMLQFSIPPGYRRRERPVSKKLGPHMAWIDAILEGDRSVHKKQRHTAHRNAGAVRLTLKSLFLLTRLVHNHAAIRYILSPPFTDRVPRFRDPVARDPQEGPPRGAFLPASLMHLYSGVPMHFVSGVDT